MAQAFKMHDVVALLRDLPRHRLARGQVGTIVEVYKSGRYEVEFANPEGETLALVTLPAGALLRLSYDRGRGKTRSRLVA